MLLVAVCIQTQQTVISSMVAALRLDAEFLVRKSRPDGYLWLPRCHELFGTNLRKRGVGRGIDVI
jgi:hypothetical protein